MNCIQGLFRAAVLFAVLAASAQAQVVPMQVQYQGYLTTSTGAPVNGPRNISFRLYETQGAPLPVWAETHENVPVANGRFSVLLGSVQPLEALVWDTVRWLGMQVAGDEEMTPRQALGSAPFALRSQSAIQADAALSAQMADSAAALTGTVAGSQIIGAISGATISGSQVIGAISNAELSGNALGALDGRFLSVQANVLSSVEVLTGGQYGALAIGSDGNPVIAYLLSTPGGSQLRVAKCANPYCTAMAAITTVDPTEGSGRFNAIAIGTDGNPVIAYHTITGPATGELRVAKCGNPDCSGAATISTVDGTAMAGQYIAIAPIGPDGNPTLSYYVPTGALSGELRVAKCANPACSGAATISVVVNDMGNTGSQTAIALGFDGLPVIAYLQGDPMSGQLRVAKCADAACAGGATIATVDATPGTGQFSSIAIGADGNPVVSYYASLLGELKLAKCSSPSCTGMAATISTLDTGNSGQYSSIRVGSDGLPVISYYEGQPSSNGRLKLAKCLNSACIGRAAISVVDGGNARGRHSALALGADGLPAIVYLDESIMGGGVRFAKCGSPGCADQIAASRLTGEITAATIGGAQVTGALTGATIAGAQVTGTLAGSQISGALTGATIDGAQVTGSIAGSQVAGVLTGATIDGAQVTGSIAGSQVTGAISGATISGTTLSQLQGQFVQAVQPPQANTLTAVDTAGSVGFYTSITIGADGLPVISYFDFTNGDLKVTKCGNAACSSGNTLTAVDTAGSVGFYTSITIGADGLPVISYFDFTNGDLKVAKCGSAACSSGNTLTAVDAVGSVGSYTSIAIGADGLPVISYLDATNGNLKVAKCGNAHCSSGNTLTAVDTVGMVGEHTSIAIGADGLPVISYYDDSNQDLKVAKCGNAACSSGNVITAVDTSVILGRYTSIAIGVDSLPVISYIDGTNGDLKVAKCGDAACSAGNTLTAVDTVGIVGEHTSIAIGADGLPVISYWDQTNGDLKVAKCGNAACSAGNVITALDTVGNVGPDTSATIGADGLPVISYLDFTNFDLKVAKCANTFCRPFFRRR